MSFADGVQPDQGQGTEGPGDAQPYHEYLERIPEQLRGEVEPVFKDWDANVTRRFQDASEFRKNWEPYQETGVHQIPPEEVRDLVAFREALSNPQIIQQWYQGYAQQNGLADQEEAPEPFADYSEVDDETGNLLRQQLEQSLGPINQQLEEFMQWRQQQETQAMEYQAMEQIESQLAKLEKDHPDSFNREWIEKLVANHMNDPSNAVQLAFQDYEQIRNAISKETLQSKLGVPMPPESGGMADGSVEQPKTFKEANQMAMERLRAARQG